MGQIPTATTAATPPPFALFPASTMPSTGDLNPYGIAFVPPQEPFPGSGGPVAIINPGDILVSNFNNGQNAGGTGNLQGLGTSIVRIQPNGVTSTFYQTPPAMAALPGHPGQGLTNALVALQNGMVIVGSLPTTDGTFATVGAGSLLFIRRDGVLSTSIVYENSSNPTGAPLNQTSAGYITNAFFGGTPNLINGPWSMAVNDGGATAQIFLSNVLAGTVVRFDLAFDSDGNGVKFTRPPVVLAQGLNHENDANFFLLGPSGLAYDAQPSSANLDTLFISDSKDNAIYMLQGAAWNAGTMPVQLFVIDTTHLHGPMGLALSPLGDLYSAQMDGNNVDPNQPSEIVIYDSMTAQFEGQFSVDPQNGGAFGVAIQQLGTLIRPTNNKNFPTIATQIFRFAAVNDNFAPGNPLSTFKTPVLNLWTMYQ